MKFLIIGDPHYSKNNREETEVAEREIQRVLQQTKPDHVVILGDLIDRLHLVAHTDAMQFVTTLSKQVPVILLVGNHDRISNQDYLSHYHPFHGLDDRVTVVDQPIVQHGVAWVPYVPDGKFEEAIQELAPHRLMVAHQAFPGCGVHCQDQPPSVPVVSGHIHTRMVLWHGQSVPVESALASGQWDVYYPGSLLCNQFRDAPARYLALVTLNPSLTITEFPIQVIARTLYTLQCPLTPEDKKLLKKANKYMKFYLSGEPGDVVETSKSKELRQAELLGAAVGRHVVPIHVPITQSSYQEQLRQRIEAHTMPETARQELLQLLV